MGWLEIMDAVKSVPQAEALRVHLDAAWREEERLKTKIEELGSEITNLNQELRSIRAEIHSLKAEIAHYKTRPIIIDIGPCAIKRYKDKPIMPGFYCNACGLILERGDYTSYPDSFVCQKCRGFWPGKLVEQSLQLYLDSE